MVLRKNAKAKTLLAAYRERYGTSIVRLARDLKVGRNHIYHLLDPADSTYARHVVSDQLFARLAAYLETSEAEVRANYLSSLSSKDTRRRAA